MHIPNLHYLLLLQHRHTIHSSIRVEQLESTLSQALTRAYSNYRSTLHNDQQSNFQNWMPELRQCVIRHNTSVFSLFARCSPPPCIQQNQKRIMMISPHMISYDGAERPKVIYIYRYTVRDATCAYVSNCGSHFERYSITLE